MHQVQLDDQLYKEAERQARQAGFSTVDEYVADLLGHNHHVEADSLDDLFTGEVIADLDRISAQIKAGGKTYTLDEVDDHFDKKRKEWLQNHAG
jgi:hypothetical protein